MKFSFLLLFFLCSCLDKNDLGATVGDCDEFCTAYNVSKNALKDRFDLSNKDFPNKKSRSQHVEEIGHGGILYKVNSWYHKINEDGDTLIVDFSCIVEYDSKNVRYRAKELKTEYRKR